jgi:ribosome biogenesis GTPase
MELKDLGYNEKLEKFRLENNLSDFETGRIIAEHKERYIVKTEKGDLEAEITGNLRFSAKSREDFPAVGDWVAITIYDADYGIIHKIFPRSSVIARQAINKFGELQIIATNIDYALLIQAADRDFNVNRLERYLTICYSSKVSPVIILTKTDLFAKEDINKLTEAIQERIKDVPVIPISNQTHDGYEGLKALLKKGKTYCMLGSSGVGKSTLMNNLCGKNIMKTNSISTSTNKGRHVTSHRELIVLENGAILIDNPGMKEVGIVDSSSKGLETTFDEIFAISQKCKFKNCTHTTETECAVKEAIETGEIDQRSFENFVKMEKEKAHYESTVAEKRKKDKTFGKMVKNFKKDMNKNSF